MRPWQEIGSRPGTQGASLGYEEMLAVPAGRKACATERHTNPCSCYPFSTCSSRAESLPALIELAPNLGELFTLYWTRILPPHRRGNLALPFFHLRSDGSWQLVPKPGKQDVVKYAVQIRSLTRLQDAVIGARLYAELYGLLRARGPRDALRIVLIEAFFAPEVRSTLTEQGAINYEAFRYSEQLLRREYGEVAEALAEEGTYRPAARDQGFRRAVVKAYAHCCALCGIRMLTLDGHTAVDASHIKPWSLSRDDRPANGMALCKLCHWSFDKGLLGISQRYTVMSSAQLFAHDNFSGHLSSLKGRAIGKPSERMHWPDPDSLRWHRREVFRAL